MGWSKKKSNQKRGEQSADAAFEEWMLPDDAEEFLLWLCGGWYDTQGSSYIVSEGLHSDLLDVQTIRPSGATRSTSGLIHIEWRSGWGRVVWGHGGPGYQYKLSSCSQSTLEWSGSKGKKSFQWYRDEDEDEDEDYDYYDEEECDYDYYEEEYLAKGANLNVFLPAVDAESLLRRICGIWSDSKRSSYRVSESSTSDKLDVVTERPNGAIRSTKGLIHIRWNGERGQVVWGYGGPRRQYTISSYDGENLGWKGVSSSFKWQRVEEETDAELSSDYHWEEPTSDVADLPDHPVVTILRTPEPDDAAFPPELEPDCADLHLQSLRVQEQLEATSEECARVLEQKQLEAASDECARVLDALTVDSSSPLSKDSKTKARNRNRSKSTVYGAQANYVPPGNFVPGFYTVPMFYPWNPWNNYLEQVPSRALSQEEVKQVRAQCEYWFSDENLKKDVHMKTLMNEEGWIYLGNLQCFSRMITLGADIWAMRLALIPSEQLELDGTAFYVRIRDQKRRDRWLQGTRES